MAGNTIFHDHTFNKEKVTELDRGNYKVQVYKDKHDRTIGIKSSLNYWKIFEYDNRGNKVYEHDSDGNWEKRKYDKQNTIVHFNNSSGTYWEKK